MCSFLHAEMILFLKDEGRYFGKVKSFMNNLRDAFWSFEGGTTEEEMDSYGRVLGVLRSTIYREFRRLGYRRLSSADRVICIMKKILELIDEIELEESEGEFRYTREVNTCRKVINRMFENICIHGKNDDLTILSDLILESANSERYCKFTADMIDLYHIIHPKPKVKTLESPETLLDSVGSPVDKAKEISL